MEVQLHCCGHIKCCIYRCDEIVLDGSKKPPTQRRSSYSCTMQMRAAMTYGFGQLPSRSTTPWHLTESGNWQGNLSISPQVLRYMVSLRRWKVRIPSVIIKDRC